MTSLSAQATSHRQPRSRRYVSPGTIRFVRFLGFRYSQSRDAYILRLVGGRFGPVLRPNAVQPTEVPAASPPAEPPVDLWNQPAVTADDVRARPRAFEYERR